MLSFENALDDTVAPTPLEDTRHRADELGGAPTVPIAHDGEPSDAAARMLELAALTAEQLIASAQTDAESLVSAAQAEAGEILATSRDEARQAEAELSRRRHEQTAELDRERATALAGLADEKAALEAKIATLRQLESDHRSEMHRHLTEQLALLDATMPDPPAAGAL